MKHSVTLFWVVMLYVLLTASQCTKVVTTTKVHSAQKISRDKGNFNGGLDAGDHFGAAIANIGDLEGDGVIDLAVGAPGDDQNGDNRGAVWILFMNSDGTVDTAARIGDNSNGFGANLDNNDRFGSAVAGLGDFNGDGFADVAVGVPYDDDGGDDRGAVWLLFLNADGSVAGSRKISDKQGNFGGNLSDADHFGNAVADIGDLDGDGIADLAVGAELANVRGTRKGAVWILFMNSDGSARSSREISDGEGNFKDNLNADDRFGSAVAALGDLDGDGVDDLAVGADGSDTGGTDRGAIWILFMNTDGTVKDQRKIASGDGDFKGTLNDGDGFGGAIAKSGTSTATV